jgi:hypothetical protein
MNSVRVKAGGVLEGKVSMKTQRLAGSTLSVYREPPPRLEGFQVAVDGPYPSFFPLRDLGYGQSVAAGINCPDDPPLTG